MLEEHAAFRRRIQRALAGGVEAALLWQIAAALGVWDLTALPTGAVMTAVVLAGALSMQRESTRALLAWSLVVALAVLACVALTPLTSALTRGLVRGDALPSGQASAVVVLASFVSDDDLLDQEALDRLLTGLQLIREGRSTTLVLSRPHNAVKRGVSPDAEWRRLLSLLPASPQLRVINDPTNTHDEAVATARLARENQWHDVLVVTSPLHTARACAAFERAGLAVTCVPCESRDIAVRALGSPPDRIRAFAMWLHEQIGSIVYRQREWI